MLQAQRERDGALTEQAASTFDKLAEAGQGLRGQLLESIDEYRRLFHTLAGDASDDGYVFVTDTANPGTRIQIKRFPHNITTPLQSCAFRISHGDLKVQDFGEVQRIYKIQHGKMPG